MQQFGVKNIPALSDIHIRTNTNGLSCRKNQRCSIVLFQAKSLPVPSDGTQELYPTFIHVCKSCSKTVLAWKGEEQPPLAFQKGGGTLAI